MRPEFLCFFAVTFAVFLGVLWEIFEFAVDKIAPIVNMQSGETGVADTMHDLIVDTLGAIVVALMGLWLMPGPEGILSWSTASAASSRRIRPCSVSVKTHRIDGPRRLSRHLFSTHCFEP